MLFDGLRIEHQCRPRAVAAADASTTIVYRSMFLSSLLRRPIQCFPLQIWLDKEPCGYPPFWKAVPKTRVTQSRYPSPLLNPVHAVSQWGMDFLPLLESSRNSEPSQQIAMRQVCGTSSNPTARWPVSRGSVRTLHGAIVFVHGRWPLDQVKSEERFRCSLLPGATGDSLTRAHPG